LSTSFSGAAIVGILILKILAVTKEFRDSRGNDTFVWREKHRRDQSRVRVGVMTESIFGGIGVRKGWFIYLSYGRKPEVLWLRKCEFAKPYSLKQWFESRALLNIERDLEFDIFDNVKQVRAVTPVTSPQLVQVRTS
jgi:hypothetical protein